MSPIQAQSTKRVLMVTPDTFGFNSETEATNSFQNKVKKKAPEKIRDEAISEFNNVKAHLEEAGVTVSVHKNRGGGHVPDAVFPNNWFSTHPEHGGVVVLYPMMAPNRRRERDPEIIAFLRSIYPHLVDLTGFEKEEKFLEGTGSLVLDRANRIAFICKSPRSDVEVIHAWASALGYAVVMFNAYDHKGNPCYHTNVVMSLGSKFAIVCLDSISDSKERDGVEKVIRETGRDLISISMNQMTQFCANCLELMSEGGDVLLALSQTAHQSLIPSQLENLQSHARAVVSSIPIIEKYGGGSLRCMLAELY